MRNSPLFRGPASQEEVEAVRGTSSKLRSLIKIIRGLAVILGVFWIGLSLLDILGVVPFSDEMRPLTERLLHLPPMAVSGVLLVYPYRFIRTLRVRIGIAAGLALIVFWMLWLSISAVRGYNLGNNAWQVTPMMTALVVVNVLNVWAFVRITDSKSFEVASVGDDDMGRSP